MALKNKKKLKGNLKGQAPEIEFGRLYEDRITGFKGRCTGFSSFISGCDQALIVQSVDKNGKKQESMWIDDDRLIDVEAEQRVKRTSIKGGPQEGPSPRDC